MIEYRRIWKEAWLPMLRIRCFRGRILKGRKNTRANGMESYMIFFFFVFNIFSKTCTFLRIYIYDVMCIYN